MSVVIETITKKPAVNNGKSLLNESDFFPLVLKINTKSWTDDQYFDFCQKHADLKIETNKAGDIVIMPPTGGETGDRNAELTMQLRVWAKEDGRGKTFDSNTEFKFPSGINRAPDGTWIKKSRYYALSKEEREKFPPICPDFVIELRSNSDRLKPLQEKMTEYIENGVRLAWLIDPYEKKVHIYRANGEIEILNNPASVDGEDVLEGFSLDLSEIL